MMENKESTKTMIEAKLVTAKRNREYGKNPYDGAVGSSGVLSQDEHETAYAPPNFHAGEVGVNRR